MNREKFNQILELDSEHAIEELATTKESLVVENLDVWDWVERQKKLTIEWRENGTSK